MVAVGYPGETVHIGALVGAYSFPASNAHLFLAAFATRSPTGGVANKLPAVGYKLRKLREAVSTISSIRQMALPKPVGVSSLAEFALCP